MAIRREVEKSQYFSEFKVVDGRVYHVTTMHLDTKKSALFVEVLPQDLLSEATGGKAALLSSEIFDDRVHSLEEYARDGWKWLVENDWPTSEEPAAAGTR